MPLDIIPKSLYPLVPNAPGVPALLRQGAQLLDTLTLGYLGVGNALTQLIGEEPIKWAVLDSNGKPIAQYDSVFAVGYQNDSRVSDYPVEQGSFASYNKVDSPFDVVVTLNCGGSEAQRAGFLADVDAARRSLQTYTVLTPECSYKNVNFTTLNVQRSTREGAGMVVVQLSGREIREKASAAYALPKDVGAYDVKPQGMIQAVDDPSFDASGVV